MQQAEPDALNGVHWQPQNKRADQIQDAPRKPRYKQQEIGLETEPQRESKFQPEDSTEDGTVKLYPYSISPTKECRTGVKQSSQL